MEQYLKYKEAAINDENAFAADDNIKVCNLSEKEYKEVSAIPVALIILTA